MDSWQTLVDPARGRARLATAPRAAQSTAAAPCGRSAGGRKDARAPPDGPASRRFVTGNSSGASELCMRGASSSSTRLSIRGAHAPAPASAERSASSSLERRSSCAAPAEAGRAGE